MQAIGAWECSQLFPGASCRLRDDWRLHQRRLQRAQDRDAEDSSAVAGSQACNGYGVLNMLGTEQSMIESPVAHRSRMQPP
jgi:hypothetical protein